MPDDVRISEGHLVTDRAVFVPVSALKNDGTYTLHSDFVDALTAIGDGTPGADGAPGPSGAETILFGTDLSTDDVLQDWVSDPYVVSTARTIVDAVAWLRYQYGSARVVVDLQLDNGGGYASIFTTSPDTRLIVPSATRASPKSLPAISAMSAISALRAKVIEAPASSAALSWRAASAAGDGATVSTTSLNVPIPTATANGDLIIAALWSSATAVTWPVGWTPAAAPLPFGSTIGPMWLYIASKISSGGESTTQAVTFASTPSVIESVSLPGGGLVAPSATVVNDGSATTSAATPSGLSTTVDGSILVHIGATRSVSGTNVTGYGWSNSLPTDASAITVRSATTNFGLTMTHETKASAGFVTTRTLSWTGAARSVTTTLIVTPSGGSPAKGLMVAVRLQQP